MPVSVINRYDYEAQKKIAPGVDFKPEKNKNDRSITNQADMPAADINLIMARYEKTGVLVDDLGNQRQPMYGDFTEVKDYHTMLSALRRTEAAFNLLPVSLRNRFENDPQKLIQFLDDPKNDKEAVKLGLKDASIFLTELDLDGITKISPEDKATVDALTPEKKAARLQTLKNARSAGIDPATGAPLPKEAPPAPPAQ